MALSRLRLRLALGYSLAFGLGLILLSAGALAYLWRESHHRLDARLDVLRKDVSINLEFERSETPDSNAAFVASEVVFEWPRNGGSFVICDSAGKPLAHTDSAAVVGELLRSWSNKGPTHIYATRANGNRYRLSTQSYHVPFASGTATDIEVVIVAFANTEGISEDTELLFFGLLAAAPLILLASLSAGYVLAGRALRPVAELRTAVAAIAPNDLSHRLPVAAPPDELDALAAEFNGMLTRLSTAQSQNRKFLREAAHQIRTPLTLVLGEAALELAAADSSSERMRSSLHRIGLAAERMRRRVDELFLLAEAQAGEPVSVKETVELDDLVLRATDLMRARATALGRALAIGTAEHVVTRGNASLLHEALLEMVENALRHGDTTRPVTVSVYARQAFAVVEVISGGATFSLPEGAAEGRPQGLGLPIVRWVSEVHGGELLLTNHEGWNSLRLQIPVVN